MKKYFCVSDVHSFFEPLQEALNKRGFDLVNPNHILVVLGDLFDRGPASKQLYDFVRGLPQDRFIYIRGNHEDLIFDAVREIELNQIISRHHISNGTLRTIADLSGIDYDKYFQSLAWYPYHPIRGNALDAMPEVLDYISKKCVDYAEIGDFLLVHGWIPGKDWRNADKDLWYGARWENGMQAWHNGIKDPEKTIICGHWHCSWGWSHLRQERKEFPQKTKKDWQKSFEPFIDDGIIAIDACTAYSGIINCIVLEVED